MIEDMFRHGVPLCAIEDFLHYFRLLFKLFPLSFRGQRGSFPFFSFLLHVDLSLFILNNFSFNTMCGPICVELSVIRGLFKPSGWILPRSRRLLLGRATQGLLHCRSLTCATFCLL